MTLWIEDYVIKNKFSRPAYKLLGVMGVVIHWTATNGATDENEQKFFDGSDGGGSRYASAHIFVDKDSATLIIPLDEVAYHANDRPCKVVKLQATASYYKSGGANLTTIGVEMCVEKDGTIHPDTIKRTMDVVAELCKRFKLNPLTDVYRHYDITGKNCPAPFVSNPQKFVDFKNGVNTILNKPATTTAPKPSTNLYRVRKSWTDVASQIGAFGVLESAVILAKANVGYKVYDGSGKQVYPIQSVISTSKPVKHPKPTSKPKPKPKLTLPSGVYKRGEKGNAVKQIQDALNKLNFKCGVADGDFGAKTYDALRRFQSVYCNPVDGVYGTKTKAKMEELLNK